MFLSTIPKELYVSPEMETSEMVMLSFLCTSPQDGHNEDVGFEDWGI